MAGGGGGGIKVQPCCFIVLLAKKKRGNLISFSRTVVLALRLFICGDRNGECGRLMTLNLEDRVW